MPRHIISKINWYLFRQIDSLNLSIFRIFYGFILAWYVFQFRSPQIIDVIYNPSDFHFTYTFFHWLGFSFPGFMHLQIVFIFMIFSALFVGLGFLYRWSLAVFLMLFSYGFLLDKTYYNNHYYLIILLGMLLALTPANRVLSLDAFFKKEKKSALVDYWPLFLMQAQICLVYFYAGLAKCNADWLSGAVWQNIYPGVQYSQSEAINSFIVYAIGFSSMIIDFLIPALLIIKKTRWVGVMLATFFHLMTKALLDIGIFPYFMIASMILFCDSSFVRGVFKKTHINFVKEKEPRSKTKGSHAVIGFVCIYLSAQALIPLRHWLYPGNVSWTQEGDRFAWRMFSHINKGFTRFYVASDLNQHKEEVPLLYGITPAAYWKMSYTPDMILQYAKHLKEKYRKIGVEDPIITVDAFVSLNGRKFARLINPTTNLAEENYQLLRHAPWVYLSAGAGGVTDIKSDEIAKFFSPAYQLAVINNNGLVKEQSAEVRRFDFILTELSSKHSADPQQIADELIKKYSSEESQFFQKGRLLEFLENMLKQPEEK